MNDTLRFALVFIGAGAGGVARYALDRALLSATRSDLPLGTLAINLSGCLLIGLLYPLLGSLDAQRAEPWRLLMAVGLLGGYTTFSAFGRETVSLAQQGRWAVAGAYVAASLIGGLAAVWIGMRLSRG